MTGSKLERTFDLREVDAYVSKLDERRELVYRLAIRGLCERCGADRRFRRGGRRRRAIRLRGDRMTGVRRILIVDDDAALRHSLTEQLQLHEEFSAAQAETGAEALDVTKCEHFDAIVLDVGLPDMDGRELCRLMRRGGVRAPILMLTGADTDADTILGLDSGANDYITKPFRLNVLLARLRAQFRQHELSEDAVFTIGPYTFRPSAKLLVDEIGRKKVRLTEKETAILKYLYRAGDKVIGRDTLLNEVWGYTSGVRTHTLDTHVYRLRQKIERDPAEAQILVTEPGGYRLVP
jgi:DNA-binding response OmpR family regulator